MSNPQMLTHHLEPHHLEPHHLEPSPSRAPPRKFAPPGLLSLLVSAHIPCGVQAYHARPNGEAHLVFAISSLHIKKCARTSQKLVSYRVAATVDREWPTLARTHARRSVSGARRAG